MWLEDVEDNMIAKENKDQASKEGKFIKGVSKYFN